MVVARKDDFCAHLDRLTHRLKSTVSSRVHRLDSRLRTLEARSGYTGTRGRVALRGRRVAELAHELVHAVRARIALRERNYQSLRLSLETFNLRRRLARVRSRLIEADGRLSAAMGDARHRSDGQLRGAAARLEALSPLAVLGRGYAVCWNGDRTAIIRDAGTVAAGERVRVTLARGELACEVKGS
jgi:exodeoxyribonuclease VII large subunit